MSGSLVNCGVGKSSKMVGSEMDKRVREARRMWIDGASEEVWSGSRFVGRIGSGFEGGFVVDDMAASFIGGHGHLPKSDHDEGMRAVGWCVCRTSRVTRHVIYHLLFFLQRTPSGGLSSANSRRSRSPSMMNN